MTNQIMSNIDQQTLNDEWMALVKNTPSEYGNPIADRIAKIMNLKLNGNFEVSSGKSNFRSFERKYEVGKCFEKSIFRSKPQNYNNNLNHLTA